MLTTELREFRADRTARDVAVLIGRCPQVVRNEARRRGLPLAPQRRGWAESIRRRALELRARGEPVRRIGRMVGVPYSTVRFWVKA
jgi:hypothetical protein